MAELKKEYAVAEKINDPANMANDAISMGDVLLEAGKPEEARTLYQKALSLQERSDLSAAVKEDARLVHHYHLGRVAVHAKDLAAARKHADAFMRGASAKKNSAEVRQAPESRFCAGQGEEDEGVGLYQSCTLQEVSGTVSR